jgi:hypothetical protein
MTTLQKQTEKRVARPLKVLVPIIKQHIREMRDAQDEAAVPYQIKIGEELIEARASFDSALEFDHWCRKTLGITGSTATTWMRRASNPTPFVRGETASRNIYNDQRDHHQPKWKDNVKDLVDRARLSARILAERELSERKERDEERKLGLRLIGIGYKILSVELHPDKRGGSHAAMSRLNKVRNRLKEAA